MPFRTRPIDPKAWVVLGELEAVLEAAKEAEAARQTKVPKLITKAHDLGLSYVVIAARMGISRQRVRQIELGGRIVTAPGRGSRDVQGTGPAVPEGGEVVTTEEWVISVLTEHLHQLRQDDSDIRVETALIEDMLNGDVGDPVVAVGFLTATAVAAIQVWCRHAGAESDSAIQAIAASLMEE